MRTVEKEPRIETPDGGEFVLDYKEKNGKPYLAEMLGASLMLDEVSDELSLVDEWVILEITRRGLNGKKEAYEEIISDLCGKLEMSQSILPSEKVKRLAIFLRKALSTQKEYQRLGVDLKSLEELYST